MGAGRIYETYRVLFGITKHTVSCLFSTAVVPLQKKFVESIY